MSTPIKEYSPNTIKQYSEMFTHIVPVRENLARLNREKLNVTQVDFDQHLAFSGFLKDDIIFIDIDDKNGDTTGTKEWKKMLVELDLDEELGIKYVNTLVHSTKSGGYHLFFRLPKGCLKDAIPNRLSSKVEVKKIEAYLANSYITDKGVSGSYSVFKDCEIAEAPNPLVMMMLSHKDKKKKKVTEEEKYEVPTMASSMQGDNTVNWDNITFEDLKIKMESINPDVDYGKWRMQMYLFMSVYFKLKELGKDIDISCQDFLINWSTKGVNRGADDKDRIRSLVDGFSLENNLEKLLPENNYLITNFNSDTKFESYAREFACEVKKLRDDAISSGKIKAFVERYLDNLAGRFIEDVLANKEYFMLDQDYNTGVYTFHAFTINNRWERITSNSNNKKTRELLQLSTIYNILSSEGRTLYSDNLRKDISVILGSEDFVNKFGQILSLKLTTSLHRVDLSSRDFPANTDIFAFKNLAIRVVKNPYSFKVISWEQVRLLRLKKEILISTESLDSDSSGDFFRKAVTFDSTIIREYWSSKENKFNIDPLEEMLFDFFAPLFWDFSVQMPLSNKYEDLRDAVLKSTRERMKTFFFIIGKAMLRYKANVLPFIFAISGSEKARTLNGSNGKTFLGQYLLTSLFGMSKVTLMGDAADSDKSDKYTEASLVNAMLQIVDDSRDSGSQNKVSIKHLTKKVGERYVKTRKMGQEARDNKLGYDTIVFANNLDKNLGSDGGTERRLLFLVLHNSNKINIIRMYKSPEEMLSVHKQKHSSYNPNDEEETLQFFMNKALNECYAKFFDLPIVKEGLKDRALADNIYFTYLDSLGEVLQVRSHEISTLEQIKLKSKLFLYSITGGNSLLQLGSVFHLKGLTPFIVEDKSAPLYNILMRAFTFDSRVILSKPQTIGIPITRPALSKMLKKTILSNIYSHEDDIDRFVQQVPSDTVKLYPGGKPIEMLNLVKLDLGYLSRELSKGENVKLEAKVKQGLFTSIQSVIEAQVDSSPYKVSNKTKDEEIQALAVALGLKDFEEIITLWKEIKRNDKLNLWLKIYKG